MLWIFSQGNVVLWLYWQIIDNKALNLLWGPLYIRVKACEWCVSLKRCHSSSLLGPNETEWKVNSECLCFVGVSDFRADSSLTRVSAGGVIWGQKLISTLTYIETLYWSDISWGLKRNGHLLLLEFQIQRSAGSRQSPLSEKRPRLGVEQSCVGMSSVWITLVSQTHVCSRLHLPPSVRLVFLPSHVLQEISSSLDHVKFQSLKDYMPERKPLCI